MNRETIYFLRVRNGKQISGHFVHYLPYTLKYFSWENLGWRLKLQFRKLQVTVLKGFRNACTNKVLPLLQMNSQELHASWLFLTIPPQILCPIYLLILLVWYILWFLVSLLLHEGNYHAGILICKISAVFFI